jgi:hypothetical protein
MLQCIFSIATIQHRIKQFIWLWESGMASSSTAPEQVFVGPGLSPFKRIVTVLGVIGLTALVLWIFIHQGASAIGSTIAAIIFIFGFIIYLRIVAPVPFTIELGPQALVKRSRNGEVIEVPWDSLTRVKEEFFPNGKRISLTVYRKPATPQEKAKAWAVYRDDLNDIDSLAKTLQQTIPATCEWKSETVHE